MKKMNRKPRALSLFLSLASCGLALSAALALSLPAGPTWAADVVPAAGAATADMELELTGVASSEGQILISVFASPEDWLKKPVAVVRAEASSQKGGRMLIKLGALPAGRLALNVAHDLNGNGRLDMNAMRMPTEPFAFSNNATGMFGPPKFEAALFEVKAGARLSVSLK